MDDSQALWLVACAGLSGIGVLLSILFWRRRGAASGLRLVSWSLLPIGLWLVGLLPIVVTFAARLFEWLTTSVFELRSWIGFAVIGLAVLLWILSGIMLGRRRAAVEAAESDEAVDSGGGESDRQQVAAGKGKSKSDAGSDDDMGDIEDILKRRGIE